MSLLLVDRIRVFLSPRSVALSREHAAWRRRPSRLVSVPVQSATGVPEWQPALAALEETLLQPEFRGAPVSVVLSSHFVRLAVIPYVASVTRDSELEVLARHHLKLVYGEDAGRLRLTLCRQPGAAPTIAGAIEPELHDAIAQMLHRRGRALTALTPYFAAAVNRHRRRFPGQGAFWLALPEPARLFVAYMRDGAWRALRSQRIRGTLREELPVILERMSLGEACDAGAGTVYVIGNPGEIGTHDIDGAWTVLPLALPESVLIASMARAA